MKNNPFCLSFGREPDRFVERYELHSEITESLNSGSPSNNSYLITGVRGSGKTVFMGIIANELRELDDWVVVSLNPGRDLLQMMAAGLYENSDFQSYFLESKLNLSKFGIGIDVKEVPPISDIQIAIEKMVRIINEKGKRILITIDDATKSDNLIAFAAAFQDLLTQKRDVYLIMTGLYENIYTLRNDDRSSFLLRAEQLYLGPLSRIGMKNLYMQTFNISEDDALKMAAVTKGYSYAFQVLGYIMWEKECTLEEALPLFDERMSEYCYEKIWHDCSQAERNIITAIAMCGKIKTSDLTDMIGGNKNSFSVQRNRLIKKGILDGRQFGYLSLALPRFEVFVNAQIE